MSISPLALQAKRVIESAWLHGAPYDLASQAAFALESAQLLQSPETAAESALSADAVRLAEASVAELKREHEENARLRARITELEQERHTTNEALDDAVRALRARGRKEPAQPLSFAELAQRESNPARRQAWRMLAQVEESERVFEALTPSLEDPHDSPLHHSYLKGRDLPSVGGA
jgi:hypothetical protein